MLVVRETRAKPGYLLDDTPQTAEIKAGQTMSLEFRNQPLGNLIIHKLSGADKKTPLEGAQFKITYADGSFLPDENGQLSSNGLYWSNLEGQIILSGITGTVVVTEVQSVPGYTIDEGTRSQTVVVNPDDTQHLYFYNDPEKTLVLQKNIYDGDKNDKPLAGVEFLVTDSTGAYIGPDNGRYVPVGGMESARNPLNKYSTIRKRLDLQGVGPAYSFAKAITNKTGRPLGLVVNARGGSSINSWMKGAKDNYYDEALSRIRQAMKFGTLKAIIWHQGESDSNAPETYILKLQELVANLRKDLNNARLPFIVGELAEWRINGTSETFNEMLRTVPQHIPYSYCVSSKELVPLIDENDPHFSADSQIILGRRYADAAYKACYSEE